jgi:lysophospholipase L1-like esterase
MAAGGSLKVLAPSLGAVTVTLTGQYGTSPKLYTDSTLGTTVTNPFTVNALTTTKVYVPPGVYTLSVQLAGKEGADPRTGTTLTLDMTAQGDATFDYSGLTLATAPAWTAASNVYSGLVARGWGSVVGRSPTYSQGTLGFTNGNGGNYQQASAATFPFVSGLVQYVACQSAPALKIAYGAFAYGTDLGNNVPVSRVTVEYPQGSGTLYDGNVAGSGSFTVPNGQIILVDVPVAVVAGTAFNVRTYVAFGSPQSTDKWPSVDVFRTGDKSQAGTTANDQSHATFAGHTSNQSACYGPCGVLGQVSGQTLVAIGDSRVQGVGDSYAASGLSAAPAAGVGLGWAARLNNNTYGFINAARHAELGIGFLDSVAKHRLRLIASGTRALCNYGINDIRINNIAASDLQVTVLNIWQWLADRGVKNWQATYEPVSNSTDLWMTLANQTITSAPQNTTRVAMNNWFRDGSPINPYGYPVAAGTNTAGTLRAGSVGHPSAGYLEVADAVESSRDSGLWKATGRAITDLNTTASSTAVTSATANFTSADVGKIIRGPYGTAGAVVNQLIGSVQSTTAATITVAAVISTAGVAASIGYQGEYTNTDGLHPSAWGHQVIAAALTTNTFA